MGKKFLKFLNDPAGPVDGKKKSRGGEPLRPRDEDAARPGGVDPLDGPVEDRELSPTDEAASRYVQPAVDIEDVAPIPDNYLEVLAEQTGLRVVKLSQYDRPPTPLIKLLTKEQAEQLMAVPVVQEQDGTIVVAIADPSNPMIIDDIRAIISEYEIEPVVASDEEIKERIDAYYGMGDETLEDIAQEASESGESPLQNRRNVVEIGSDVDTLANDPPVIRLVNLLLVKAIKERASDIHVEPFPNIIRIRYRVDGVLREIPSPPRNMLSGLVARIKVMALLDIAESRLPQDGRIKIAFEGREVDLRISTMPTVHGEAIVMRVLDKSMMMIGIREIGMRDEIVDRFLHHVHKPNGIVLVTGPTGCGKTTTLYAGLQEINDPGDKIITVEDPVEFELPGLVQVNINDNVGLTFARTLRAILRQDPDRVLIGEIRDVETAQIAVQAALTGHLVFSTLHTNSAAATVIRLIDMGVPAFMITSSLEAVLAQRLVRTICSSCRTPYTPYEEEMLEFNLTDQDVQEQTFFHGEGCSDCGHSGYRGRLGLFELLEVDEELKDLVLDQGTTDELQAMARRKGMMTMREDGMMKISLGLTTFEEVGAETVGESEEERQALASHRAEPPESLEEDALQELSQPDDTKRSESPQQAAPQAQPQPKPQLDESKMNVSGEEAASVGNGAGGQNAQGQPQQQAPAGSKAGQG